MTYRTQMKVHFDEADPAGIAFSGTVFTKMHRCYEEFVERALEISAQDFFLNPELIFPLRKTETEFLAPLLPLKSYEVEISVTDLSMSRFDLQFEIRSGEKTMARVRSVHVCVDPKTMTKSQIPGPIKQNLEKFVTQQ